MLRMLFCVEVGCWALQSPCILCKALVYCQMLGTCKTRRHKPGNVLFLLRHNYVTGYNANGLSTVIDS